MAHILFTAINYWPEPSGNAPYTTALAEHLALVGHRVTVVAGVPHYPKWHVDPAYRRGLTWHERVGGVEIIRKRHLVPPRQTLWGRALYEGTFFLNGITARGAKPDLVVGVVPSLSGAAIARILAARWHVPYAVIVQDLMGPAASESGIRGGHRISGLVARAEAWSLRRARLVAPVSEAFLPYLHSIGIPDQRIAHLPNWTLHSRNDGDRAETRRRLGWGDEQIVLHAGNMGLKQHLEQVLAVAQLAIHDAPDVRFVLLGDGNQRSALQRQAVMLPNVEFLPTQGDDDYDLALNAADVLLVSERATVADMSLPSKLTAYCAAGRPIVAAVRQNGATYHEVISSGAGLVVPAGHPEELLEALGRLREDPALCDRLSAAGRRYAAEALMGSAALARAEALVDGLLRSARAGESTS